MNSNNEYVREFLNYYCELELPPGYAVLLSGRWGAGKTWFIDNFTKDLKQDERKVFYISLYGLTTLAEIDEEIYRQMHPVLSSKKMIFLAKVAKGFLRTTVKIDFDQNHHDQASINSGIPELNLSEFAAEPDKCILIFDDIERCRIDISDLFGYINYFVEHANCKVILVANEEEIIKGQENEIKTDESENQFLGTPKYLRIREKLIGKKFEIEPELDDALNSFLERVEDRYAREVLNDQRQLLCDIYQASKSQNLRHLRRTIQEIERLLKNIPSAARKKIDLITHLLGIYQVFIYEIHCGNLKPSDILAFPSAGVSDFLAKVYATKNNLFSEIVKKYPFVELTASILPVEMWFELLERGQLNRTNLTTALTNSRYFITEIQPDWVRLWNAFSLEDNEVEALLKDVVDKFKAREYEEVGVIRHLTGIFLRLTTWGIYKASREEIVRDTKSYIDFLKANHKIPIRKRGLPDEIFENTGWNGLGYQDGDTKEFKEINDYLELKTREVLEESYPQEAKNLLGFMGSDTAQFMRDLILCNGHDSHFYETPILNYIKPEEFVKTFCELNSDQRKTIRVIIQGRYKERFFLIKLENEVNWLNDVSTLLKRECELRNGKMSSVVFRLLAEDCETAANNIMAISSEKI